MAIIETKLGEECTLVELNSDNIFWPTRIDSLGMLCYHRRIDDDLLVRLYQTGQRKVDCTVYGQNFLGFPVSNEKRCTIKEVGERVYLAPPRTRYKGYNLQRMEIYVDYTETAEEAEKAWVIGADGTISEAIPDHGDHFSLRALQRIVGGHIEITRPRNVEGRFLTVNENFIELGLPFNRTASGLHGKDQIQGTALLCPCEMVP